MLEDDLEALNAPLRDDEPRWEEDVMFVLADEMGWTVGVEGPRP